MRNNAPGLAALLIDQGLDEFDDPLLARGSRVQLAAHLGEPAIDLAEPAINLLETPIDVTAQVDEILSESVETRRRGTTKVADLGSDLRDIAVGGTGEDPCRRGILLDRAEPPTDVAEFVLTHSAEPSPVTSAERAPSHRSCGQRRWGFRGS